MFFKLIVCFVVVLFDGSFFKCSVHPFKVREEGRIVSKAVYRIMGLNQQGSKELLGIRDIRNCFLLAQNPNGTKNRGLKDVLIACIDKLKGSNEALSVHHSINRDPAVRNTSHTQQHEVHIPQRQQRISNGFKISISSQYSKLSRNKRLIVAHS